MRKPPTYSKNRASGHAKVRIDGRDHYLGPYGSEESRKLYDELIARWLCSGRKPDSVNVTMNRLAVLYIEHCELYYRKGGKITSEVSSIRCALKITLKQFGRLSVADFSSLKLQTVREAMIAAGWVRTSINQQVRRITRMLRWGVEQELVPADVYASCKALTGLRFGRSEATESEKVQPVSLDDVNAIEELVSRQIWAMIQLQLVTGMRPGEVRSVRLKDIDRSGDVWEYTPERHKNQHHGRDRRVFIGRKGQEIIRQFLKADQSARLFSPRDAELERNEDRRAERVSPMTPSQAARKPKEKPRKGAGIMYSKDSYNRAITRACEEARIESWTPNQLRHNAATEIRKTYGLDLARVVLGHSSSGVTEIYAEQDFDKARSVIAEFG
ncbi:MAG: site-specific integrase [Planctomycetaceae bacterium]